LKETNTKRTVVINHSTSKWQKSEDHYAHRGKNTTRYQVTIGDDKNTE